MRQLAELTTAVHFLVLAYIVFGAYQYLALSRVLAAAVVVIGYAGALLRWRNRRRMPAVS